VHPSREDVFDALERVGRLVQDDPTTDGSLADGADSSTDELAPVTLGEVEEVLRRARSRETIADGTRVARPRVTEGVTEEAAPEGDGFFMDVNDEDLAAMDEHEQHVEERRQRAEKREAAQTDALDHLDFREPVQRAISVLALVTVLLAAGGLAARVLGFAPMTLAAHAERSTSPATEARP
jgi:hypothetical protein